MFNRKKSSIALDIYKLADSDSNNVRHLNANECGKDGVKSKSIEKAASGMASGCSVTC